MYTIKQVSEKLKVPANTIRFYEKKGLLTPQRGENDYREYGMEDISRLELILLYRKMGFSIEAIRELLSQGTATQEKDVKQEKLLEQYVLQYNLLHQHIHAMELARDALGESMEELLKEEPDQEKILEKMEQTATAIDVASGWKDNWRFDDWASHYDEDIKEEGDGLDFYRHYEEVLTKTAQKVTGEQVVEVGIGTGNLALKIQQYNWELKEYIGIDQSINMLKEAKKKCHDITLRLGDFLKLPLQSEKYDCVVTSYAFHHCNSKEKELAIAEMNRILKPHGQIIITDLMFENQEARKAFTAMASVREKEDLQDEYFGNVDEVTNIFQKCGYHCQVEQIDELIWCIVAKKLLHGKAVKTCRNNATDFHCKACPHPL